MLIRRAMPLFVVLVATSNPVLRCAAAPEVGAVEIAANFPGGNVLLEKNEPGRVTFAPDARRDRPWFYWYFEAKATRPGRVTFVTPKKVIGFENGAIGNQGPAISEDGGKTWRWMGTSQVEANTFHFDFEKVGQRVRFAVTIPYLQSDLDSFLRLHSKNPRLTKSELTKSSEGRTVELLRVGKPGPDKQAVLMTCRHHASETIASYVLEGIMAEALSDSDAGKEFRKRYVLYVVPIVDKDGVEEGDQGKNRKPFDHNRDYNEKSIYPEVRAIKELGKTARIEFALDLHCPTLVMPDHQVFYFVGAKEHPSNNLDNVRAFAANIRKGLPENAPVGPLVWLRTEKKPSPKNSRYFGFLEGVVMAATLEIPFAPPKKATDPVSCRKYGAVILRAWNQTEFKSSQMK